MFFVVLCPRYRQSRTAVRSVCHLSLLWSSVINMPQLAREDARDISFNSKLKYTTTAVRLISSELIFARFCVILRYRVRYGVCMASIKKDVDQRLPLVQPSTRVIKRGIVMLSTPQFFLYLILVLSYINSDRPVSFTRVYTTHITRAIEVSHAACKAVF